MMDYKEQPHYTHEKTPLFEADTEDFLLTLFNLNYGGENEDVGQDVTQEKITDEIKMLIESNSQITTEEMAETIGVSSRTIKRHIKEMQNVVYVGSGYSGHWEIKE